MPHRLAEALDGSGACITSFPLRPRFCLAQELTELVDELTRSRVGAVELLDPTQTLENGA